MFNCHCRERQRASGGAFTPVVYVPKKAFKFTQGSPARYFTPSEAGGYNKRGFCLECGSRISGGETADGIGVTASSLDDPRHCRAHSRTAAVATLARPVVRLGTSQIGRDVGLRRAQSSRLAESGVALPVVGRASFSAISPPDSASSPTDKSRCSVPRNRRRAARYFPIAATRIPRPSPSRRLPVSCRVPEP
jgi:hypothetical protein